MPKQWTPVTPFPYGPRPVNPNTLLQINALIEHIDPVLPKTYIPCIVDFHMGWCPTDFSYIYYENPDVNAGAIQLNSLVHTYVSLATSPDEYRNLKQAHTTPTPHPNDIARSDSAWSSHPDPSHPLNNPVLAHITEKKAVKTWARINRYLRSHFLLFGDLGSGVLPSPTLDTMFIALNKDPYITIPELRKTIDKAQDAQSCNAAIGGVGSSYTPDAIATLDGNDEEVMMAYHPGVDKGMGAWMTSPVKGQQDVCGRIKAILIGIKPLLVTHYEYIEPYAP